MEWKTMMVQKALELDGVTDHGKVSQERIVGEMMSSDVWAYPTLFTEIYCITAIKAQASGAWPVTSRLAALEETVQFGDTMDIAEWDETEKKHYTDLLIKALLNRNKNRTAMREWALTQSWDQVAKDWHDEFSG
jgi:hypothetical protein